MKTPLFQIVGGFANDNYWSSSENERGQVRYVKY